MDTDETRQAEWVRAAVDRYAGPLTRYATLITGDLERARDVVQDTFVRLCAEKPNRLNAHLAQWLFTVCRNRALDVQRKESRMKSISDVEMSSQASPDLSPAAQAERREAASEVLGLLGQLPKNQQEVVRLKFQNGLSYQEISKVTNLTVGNVGFLIHTAIKTVRLQLQQGGARVLSSSDSAARKNLGSTGVSPH
jgi:RNA polymerase sigma-70 factor (ECF subfamily)